MLWKSPTHNDLHKLSTVIMCVSWVSCEASFRVTHVVFHFLHVLSPTQLTMSQNNNRAIQIPPDEWRLVGQFVRKVAERIYKTLLAKHEDQRWSISNWLSASSSVCAGKHHHITSHHPIISHHTKIHFSCDHVSCITKSNNNIIHSTTQNGGGLSFWALVGDLCKKIYHMLEKTTSAN